MKRFAHLALALVLAFTGSAVAVVVTAAPAAAACPSGLGPADTGRAWDGTGCSGATTPMYHSPYWPESCEGLGTANGYDPTWSDRITSFENADNNQDLRVWVNFGCSGSGGSLPPNSWVSNLTGGFLNNSISSYKYEWCYSGCRITATYIPNARERGTGRLMTDADGKLTPYGRERVAAAAR